MKKTIKILVLTLLAISVFSCGKTDKPENKPKATSFKGDNYNISILIDLSDRISLEKNPNPTMAFYQRDLGYIKSVSEAFTDHLKSKKLKQINDKMQIFFNPEPQDRQIDSISKNLRIAVDKNNASKELLNSISANYAAQTQKIYESAIKDNNFIGSDIWNFFDTKVKDNCIENDSRNILIILTDGYVFYEGTAIKEGKRSTYITSKLIRENGLNTGDWQKKMKDNDFGFIKPDVDLSKLEVLVLGINPDHNNPYEEKVIKAYWTKWLTEMNVQHFEIKNADLPSNMHKIIEDFIAKN
ncbi:hypothetical protein [Flavobacterium hercynium]|uniref:VWFA domain-containing protein n=1 Tax=Flavobacterium hercynium TaxID=387094 RepID=A0A226HAA0_9FLAO|nr:hypothetical protein [Flavobacterium hercynium]OXA91259.1 hypothetical protein B0A66_11840 [Flavobacterium hercynium]SMP12450.1 hypothetical protein SAMN06265346_103246 [Flavobacterium hercynium]